MDHNYIEIFNKDLYNNCEFDFRNTFIEGER
jgi:hypothetical protein